MRCSAGRYYSNDEISAQSPHQRRNRDEEDSAEALAPNKAGKTVTYVVVTYVAGFSDGAGVRGCSPDRDIADRLGADRGPPHMRVGNFIFSEPRCSAACVAHIPALIDARDSDV